MSKRTRDSGVLKVIKKGDKPDSCASSGKEMQVTQSVEVLRSKPPGVPVETKLVYRRCSLNILGSQLFDH